MNIEIAAHERMSESGSSLLRLIQNHNIPILDLIVRESVQNSLDAADGKSSSVDIDITVGDFQADQLNRHFERISDVLNKRYLSSAKRKNRFISFRDTNTEGLTGPVRYGDVKNNEFGNLLKLVYEISKPQQNEGAGGSWGLGKTIYYRLGIGLVLYYSRIRNGMKYESRLAACLVEDETRSDSLLPGGSGVRRGIAWWGKKEKLKSGTTVPLENEKKITEILTVFGISPYLDEQTGTTVIIPYVNEDALLKEVYATNEDISEKPFWVSSVSEYLKVALQRWYAPRLVNPQYPGPYLVARVNGEQLKVSSMLPVFRVIRELYILAMTGKSEDSPFLNEQKGECFIESIDLRGVLKTTSAGRLVYVKLNRRQLLMEPPANNRSPYQQITNTSVVMESGNVPVIMYTRRPGMIVGYDYDGSWTHNMPKAGLDEFIIGLFVINSENTLKNVIDPKTKKIMTLEEYIRQGEKADHASWSDRNIDGTNPRIVSNIQKHVINKIKKKYVVPVVDNVSKQNVGLSKALATILLPAEDFGAASTHPETSGIKPGKPIRPKTEKSTFRIIGEPEYTNGFVTVDYEILLSSKSCELNLLIAGEFKRYDADTWECEKEIGKEFPLEYIDFTVNKIRLTGKSRKVIDDCMLKLNREVMTCGNDYIQLQFIESAVFSKNICIRLLPSCGKCAVTGKLTFSFTDEGLRGVLELKETVL